MGETWELAAVSDDIRKNENTEFSDRMVSAYNKLMYVGSASVFISVLKLESKNSFFGFKVEELNERWIELVFLGTTGALAWNYLARVMDERRILKEVDSKVVEINNQLIANLKSISTNVDDYMRPVTSYKNLKGFIEGIADNENLDRETFDKAYHNFIDLQIAEVREQNRLQPLLSEGNATTINMLNSKKNEKSQFPMDTYLSGSALSQILQRSLAALDSIISETENISKKFDNIDLSIISKRQYFGWEKLRIISVDYLFPIILCVSVVVTFLYPNTVPVWMMGIGEFLDFR